jgi:hypothetical protein
MMLILTFQLQSVIGYSPLGTGLALVPCWPRRSRSRCS